MTLVSAAIFAALVLFGDPRYTLIDLVAVVGLVALTTLAITGAIAGRLADGMLRRYWWAVALFVAIWICVRVIRWMWSTPILP